jgi:hypothetical protein
VICTKVITENISVSAVWKEKLTYTVTFHSSDDNIPDESITVHEGDLVPSHSKIGYHECWYNCWYDRGTYGHSVIYCGWFTGPTINNWDNVHEGVLVSPNQKVYGNMDLYMHYRSLQILDHPDYGEDCSDYHHHTPSDLE